MSGVSSSSADMVAMAVASLLVPASGSGGDAASPEDAGAVGVAETGEAGEKGDSTTGGAGTVTG